jgi:hypothetical protein
MCLIRSAISARNWLAREFAVAIAMMGNAMSVANAKTRIKTRKSIGLGCRNYSPVRSVRRSKAERAVKSLKINQTLGCGVFRVRCHTPSAKAIAPSPYASTAVSP